MGQGMYVGEAAKKRGQEKVPVTRKVSSDDKRSELIIGGELVGESIPSKQSFYLPAALALQASNRQEFLIRTLDIAGSVAILFICLPVLIIITLLIKFTSLGPVIYKQQRVGKHGKIFTLYKFRTMINDAEKISGLSPATQNDSRVTMIGKILRTARLDELPQLFNILKGEMSLVGPRPENTYRVNLHKALRGARLTIKPGLTGLAQIRNSYDLKPDHKIKYDYLYIQKRSLLLNIYILLKTVPVIFCKKGW